MTWPGPGDPTPDPNRPGDTPSSPAPPPPAPPPPAAPPPAAVPPPAGAYAYPYQAVPAPQSRTNTMAIVAFICSLAGLFTAVTAPIGAILGHVARRQIRETGEDGDGMALAGIIIGWTLTGLLLLGCCIGVAFFIAAASTTTVT